MNLTKLFNMQKSLDRYIEEGNHLQHEDLFDRKILALLVEVGELANETRSFKFWSKKGPSEKTVILEEYVDGLHFILSIGLEKGLEQEMELDSKGIEVDTVTGQFLEVFESIQQFRQKKSLDAYKELFLQYITLGDMLGFSMEEVEQAYFNKNEVNYKRQQEGY